MTLALMTATTLLALSSEALGPNMSREVFEHRVFQPSVIRPFGVAPERYASLNSGSREAIVSARDTLRLFFNACHRKGADPRRYLTAGLRKKYPTGDAVRETLFDPETTVILFLVTDFAIESEERVSLSICLLLFSEGNILAQEHKVEVKRESGGWKVFSLDALLKGP
jgi:hypothetical protein